MDRIAVLDVEITQLSNTKEEPSHAKFNEGIKRIDEYTAALEKLSQRFADTKAEVRRFQVDRLLVANAIVDESKGVLSRRVAN